MLDIYIEYRNKIESCKDKHDVVALLPSVEMENKLTEAERLDLKKLMLDKQIVLIIHEDD